VSWGTTLADAAAVQWISLFPIEWDAFRPPRTLNRDSGWWMSYYELLTDSDAQFGTRRPSPGSAGRTRTFPWIPTSNPGVLIQGKLDVSSPAAMAWQLHQHWPAGRFVLINDEGHGGPRMVHAMIDTVTQFLPPLAQQRVDQPPR
jgi:proline iminopeptidase